jgi:outer membrane receptor protein involved in Fe transport
MTAGAGVLYASGAWNASLIYKQTGATYQTDYDAAKPATYEFYKVGAYTNTDLGVSYTFKHLTENLKAMKLQLNVFNLADGKKVTSISPGKVLAGDQYLWQAPRSFQVSVKADF